MNDFIAENVARAFRNGMTDRVLVNIKYVSGFERFQTYENWDQGWELEGRGMLVSNFVTTAKSKDLTLAWLSWNRDYQAALALESRGEEVSYRSIASELKAKK